MPNITLVTLCRIYRCFLLLEQQNDARPDQKPYFIVAREANPNSFCAITLWNHNSVSSTKHTSDNHQPWSSLPFHSLPSSWALPLPLILERASEVSAWVLCLFAFALICTTMTDDRPKRQAFTDWPANRRRYDVIHRQDVHPTVEWALPKTFNPDNCKQHDSFGTSRSDLTEHSLNDQTQWSCSSRCDPIYGLSCSSLSSRLTWPTVVWSMRLRLDRGSSVIRHSGDEISSYPSPNKELILVQIDDDSIQKYNHHHHHPRDSRRRHFPNINQWSVWTITWSMNLAVIAQRQGLLVLQISLCMDSSNHYTFLWKNLVLYITPDLRRYGQVINV